MNEEARREWEAIKSAAERLLEAGFAPSFSGTYRLGGVTEAPEAHEWMITWHRKAEATS